MDKMGQLILVIRREEIEGFFKNFHEGFWDDKDGEMMSVLDDDQPEWMMRGDAEKNRDYKQLIPYSLIINAREKLIYLYQRSTRDKDYPEKKLQGNYSIGVGGHVEDNNGFDMIGHILDILFSQLPEGSDDQVMFTLYREIVEEVKISGQIGEIKEIGYINDDSNEVGWKHLGIVFIVDTAATVVSPNDSESVSGKMVTLKELEAILAQAGDKVDPWTRILMPLVRKLLD